MVIKEPGTFKAEVVWFGMVVLIDISASCWMVELKLVARPCCIHRILGLYPLTFRIDSIEFRRHGGYKPRMCVSEVNKLTENDSEILTWQTLDTSLVILIINQIKLSSRETPFIHKTASFRTYHTSTKLFFFEEHTSTKLTGTIQQRSETIAKMFGSLTKHTANNRKNQITEQV